MTMKNLLFVKIDKNAKIYPPRFEGDVGYDICAVESKIIFPLFPREVRTGIILGVPRGYYATIETRSGHGVKRNLRVHRGIVDSGFRGEITVKVYNHGLLPYRVKKGERIAQIVLHEAQVLPLKETFTNTQRGVRGLGSSGKF